MEPCKGCDDLPGHVDSGTVSEEDVKMSKVRHDPCLGVVAFRPLRSLSIETIGGLWPLVSSSRSHLLMSRNYRCGIE